MFEAYWSKKCFVSKLCCQQNMRRQMLSSVFANMYNKFAILIEVSTLVTLKVSMLHFTFLWWPTSEILILYFLCFTFTFLWWPKSEILYFIFLYLEDTVWFRTIYTTQRPWYTSKFHSYTLVQALKSCKLQDFVHRVVSRSTAYTFLEFINETAIHTYSYHQATTDASPKAFFKSEFHSPENYFFVKHLSFQRIVVYEK